MAPPRTSTGKTTSRAAPLTGRRRPPTDRWLIADAVSHEQVAALRRGLNVSPAFARLLCRRGYTAPDAAAAFLAARLDGLHDPLALPDMAAAVARIRSAVQDRESIVLFGDYDVDGVSATALLARFFRVLKTEVCTLVPERNRGGYGLSPDAVARIRQLRPKLLITLDNGTGAQDAVAGLRADGIQSIVVDHHHAGGEGLPAAVAFVNPKRAGSAYPFPDLCGAGLAFKLAWALAMEFSHSRKVSPEFRAFLLDGMALAGLGTLADVVPLVGENRILARHGLKALRATQNAGLRALLAQCGVREEPVATDVTFRLGPRINAAGRCGQAADALELLLTDDPARAVALAQQLETLNAERQAIEKEILADARAAAVRALAAEDAPPALVLDSAGWHPGVIGIVAARLAEEFHRPAVLLTRDEESGEARGSGRSIPGFHLAEAFGAAAEHLVSWGGHAAAAGVKLKSHALPAFRQAFLSHARRRLTPEHLQPTLHIEDALDLAEINHSFCENLARLEPCGAGNPAPLLAAFNVSVAGRVAPLGRQEQHVSFYARQDRAVLRTVGFGFGPQYNALCDLAAQGPLDLAFRPQMNTFRGESNVELQLQAFRPAASPSPASPAAGA